MKPLQLNYSWFLGKWCTYQRLVQLKNVDFRKNGMTRIRTLHDIDNLQKWNLDNRKKMKEWPGFEPTNIRSKVRCACHITTKTQWRKSHNSSKPLVMKFTRKNQKFPKKCWPPFLDSKFEFFSIIKNQKNFIQTWETPKKKLSSCSQTISSVPVEMAVIKTEA